LSDGDKVVVDGQYRLQPGSKIQVAGDPPPAAAPAGAAEPDAAGAASSKREHRRKTDADAVGTTKPQ
ncbi:MAG: hypothetical protein M0P19_06540, partial [Nevskia sp.]|nr:hypothetical protein [Nevskia sp.]